MTQQTMLINYRAPALVDSRRPYPAYEASSVCCKSSSQMAEGGKPDIPASVFKDKIVFVGLDVLRAASTCSRRRSAQGSMPGIQLHASVADSILSNRFIRPAPRWTRRGRDAATARRDRA